MAILIRSAIFAIWFAIVTVAIYIAILPTLLTLGNGVCGFASITWTSKIVATSKR